MTHRGRPIEEFFNSSPPRRRGGFGYGLIHVECGEGRAYPNCALVKLYAKLGLHRFNWLEGTNYELDSLLSFNMGSAASPYYINLIACPSSGLQQVFQVLICEKRLGILDLTCPISRPQGTESSKPFLRPHSELVSPTYEDRLVD